MSLVFITGIAGMGKTTTMIELEKRGRVTFGIDEHDLADWINHNTGEADIYPKPTPPDFDTHDWYKQHDYVLSRARLGELSNKSNESKSMFYVCGTADGIDQVSNLFSTIIALHMDDLEKLKQRINSRIDVDFGKTDEEFRRITDWHQKAHQEYARIGAVIVDASQPIDVVVDQIESITKKA